jgi:two-component sensor histidine kinase
VDDVRKGEPPGCRADAAAWHVSSSLPIDIRAARAARELLRELGPQLSNEQHTALLLAATELVTNAYRHGPREGRVGLRARVGEEHVRLEVASPRGAELPRVTQPRRDGGMGLRLVDHIAEEWGVKADDLKVVVWVDVPRWN